MQNSGVPKFMRGASCGMATAAHTVGAEKILTESTGKSRTDKIKMPSSGIRHISADLLFGGNDDLSSARP